MDLNQRLSDCTFVAFDTETSGGYPVGHEVVEFGAVKWKNGQEIGRSEFLFKPREPMTDFIIGIHGITNEMVASAPLFKEKADQILDFFADSVLLAHHAPFDLGFMSYEFERAGRALPSNVVLCTSLLSRKLIHETANHKLQTLVQHFKFDGGSAHRAFDDAKSCLLVALECFKRMGDSATLAQALKTQEKNLEWKNFSLKIAGQSVLLPIIEAIQNKKRLDIMYDGGSNKGETRQVNPIGVVRSPDGDYLMAFCIRDKTNKRYYVSRIKEAVVIY